MANLLRTETEPWLSRAWPAVVLGGAWLWVFGPMMTGQTVVGFRDSAYLYYPLFKWIDAQWAMGEIPFWNPYCNSGIPVVGDGSSSVFYPGKLIFFCRSVSFPARYGIYLAIHIPLAAAGVYWLARMLRANRAGATLAAFSYSFGGCVLFQTTNVIYLVSAAWLPFALGCVWKMEKTRRQRWALGAGVCCALMILGGDPQMVYHVGLIALAMMASEFLRRRRRSNRAASAIGPRPIRWLVGAWGRLSTLVLVTVLLSAVQLLPTWVWAQQSERVQSDSIANIYFAVARLANGQSGDWVHELGRDWLGPPVGVMGHSYQFSQPPWSLAEMVWPNISGKPFPRNQRWASALPGADRVWVPSIYAGVLVVLVGLPGFRLWGRRRKQVRLTWLILFFGVASFGWYGAVWLVNELLPGSTGASSFGPQVGGVYWLMNILLPKYFAFRYPAKLMVVACLGLSLLAGIRFRGARLGVSSWMSAMVVLLCGVGAVALMFSSRALLGLEMPTDIMFGPFEFSGATAGLYVAFAQPALVIAVIWGLIHGARRIRRTRELAVWVAPLVVVITVADVLFANRWLVPEIASSTFELETQVHSRLEQMKSSNPVGRPMRIYRSRMGEFEPESWSVESSGQRLAEIVTWQRETLYPKHHLGERIALVGSFSSIWSVADEEFLSFWEQFDRDRDRIAMIADGVIVKLPGRSAELVDLRSVRVDVVGTGAETEREDKITIADHWTAFWMGAWVSGCGWAVLVAVFVGKFALASRLSRFRRTGHTGRF